MDDFRATPIYGKTLLFCFWSKMDHFLRKLGTHPRISLGRSSRSCENFPGFDGQITFSFNYGKIIYCWGMLHHFWSSMESTIPYNSLIKIQQNMTKHRNPKSWFINPRPVDAKNHRRLFRKKLSDQPATLLQDCSQSAKREWICAWAV